MGLLDMLQGFSDNPAAQQGLLAAGLGMLANNQGGASTGQVLGRGGLLGLQAYGGAQEAQQRQKVQEQAMALQDADTKMKQQQLAMAQQEFANKSRFDNYLLGGGAAPGAQPGSVTAAITPPAPAAPALPAPGGGMGAPPAPPVVGGGVGGVPDTSAAGGPGAGVGSATAGAMAGGGMAPSGAPLPPPVAPAAAAPGGPAGGPGAMGGPFAGMSPGKMAAIMADRAYNDGKGIANLINPNIEITPGGIVYDKNSQKVVGSVPVMDIPTGRGSQLTPMPGGGFGVAPVAGGDAVASARKNADAEVQNANTFTQIQDPSPGALPGAKITVSNQWLKEHPAYATEASPVATAGLTGANKDWQENSWRPTLNAAQTATKDIASLDALKTIPLDTGKPEWMNWAARVGTQLGLAPQTVKDYAGDVQKFQSIAMSKLQQNLAAQTGPQTEGDAQRAGATFAQLGNTPEANQFIMDFARAQSMQAQRKAQFYQDMLPAVRAHNMPYDEIDRQWQQVEGSIFDIPNSPLTKYKPKGP